MEACFRTGDAFTELIKTFTEQTQELKSLVLLRTSDCDARLSSMLESISEKVEQAERQMVDVKRYLAFEHDALAQTKTLRTLAEEQQARVTQILTSLPQHLPGGGKDDNACSTQPPSSTIKKRLPESSTPVTAKMGTDRIQRTITTNKRSRKNTATAPVVPALPFVTRDELKAVPSYVNRYIKGRVKDIERINTAIVELHGILQEKYRFMAQPMRKMGDQAFKRYKAYRSQETDDTKGCFFFTEADLRHCTSCKIDATGKAILGILRHCGRLRLVSTGNVFRYVVQSNM